MSCEICDPSINHPGHMIPMISGRCVECGQELSTLNKEVLMEKPIDIEEKDLDDIGIMDKLEEIIKLLSNIVANTDDIAINTNNYEILRRRR